jgi:hypothetical protein
MDLTEVEILLIEGWAKEHKAGELGQIMGYRLARGENSVLVFLGKQSYTLNLEVQ